MSVCAACNDGTLTSDISVPDQLPYAYLDGLFTVDVSSLNIPLTANGSNTIQELFLRPGSLISIFGLSTDVYVVGLPTLPELLVVTERIGDPVASVQIQIPPMPTAGNVYPKNNVIDGITPNTSGLTVGCTVAGAGIPAGATVTQILDTTRVMISQAATLTAAAYEALTFAFPFPIPDTGTCYLSPLIGGEGPIDENYRQCGSQFAGFGLPNNDAVWDDVTHLFESIALSISIDQTVNTSSTTSTTTTTASPPTTTTTTTTTSYALTGAYNQTFSPSTNAPARVGKVAKAWYPAPSPPVTIPPTPPGPTINGPGVVEPGAFRAYRCGGCCSNCLYFFVINILTATATYDGTADPSLPLASVATSSTTTISPPPSGESGTTATSGSGSAVIYPVFLYADVGYFCQPTSQNKGQPASLWGSFSAGYELSFAAGNLPKIPAGGSSVLLDSCELTGDIVINGTGEVLVVGEGSTDGLGGSTATTTTTTTPVGGTATSVAHTVTIPDSESGSSTTTTSSSSSSDTNDNNSITISITPAS